MRCHSPNLLITPWASNGRVQAGVGSRAHRLGVRQGVMLQSILKAVGMMEMGWEVQSQTLGSPSSPSHPKHAGPWPPHPPWEGPGWREVGRRTRVRVGTRTHAHTHTHTQRHACSHAHIYAHHTPITHAHTHTTPHTHTHTHTHTHKCTHRVDPGVTLIQEDSALTADLP